MNRTLVSDADLRRGRAKAVYFLTLAGVFVLVVAVFLLPLVWMVSGALKTPSEL
jgi:multiple sugar transport system permease protein